jgi:hypothetical protein
VGDFKIHTPYQVNRWCFECGASRTSTMTSAVPLSHTSLLWKLSSLTLWRALLPMLQKRFTVVTGPGLLSCMVQVRFTGQFTTVQWLLLTVLHYCRILRPLSCKTI